MTESIEGNPVIYTITSKENLFVGATTSFDKKRQLHKSNIAAHRRGELEDVRSLYAQIAANDFEWEMKVYAEFPCQSRAQLNAEVKRLEKELNANMDMKTTSKKTPKSSNKKGDFSNAVVYAIRSRDSVYVGSTTNFRKRKDQHASKLYNSDDNSKLYSTIRNNNNEWQMEIHSQVKCENWRHLRKEEERIRIALNADLNVNAASTEVAPEPEPVEEPKKDKKKTIVQLTAKRYTYIGAVDDFEEEKAKHTDFVAQYKRGHLMYHNVICEWISLADFDWSIKIHSEFEFRSRTNTTDGYHDPPEVEAELERIRLLLKETGDYDYVDSRAQQLIYREQEWTLLSDPVGWATKVDELEVLPKKFFHRRIGKFYNFNGTKVFWASRHIRCVHHGVKHKICRHCLLDPETDKKAYLRDIDYYQHVEKQRYRKGG